MQQSPNKRCPTDYNSLRDLFGWTKGVKWILLFLPLAIFAKDFGRLGHTFPIEEESFLEYMQRTLSNQGMNQKLLQARERMFEKAKTPPPIQGLSLAIKDRSFLLDVSYKVESDIKDQNGNTIVKAGTKVNPLEKIQLTSGLLFLDGDRQSHINWARKQEGNFKWVLVKGKPFEIEEHEKRAVYYDQGGMYTSRFRIENIPAKIVQDGKFLLVEEVALERS